MSELDNQIEVNPTVSSEPELSDIDKELSELINTDSDSENGDENKDLTEVDLPIEESDDVSEEDDNFISKKKAENEFKKRLNRQKKQEQRILEEKQRLQSENEQLLSKMQSLQSSIMFDQPPNRYNFESESEFINATVQHQINRTVKEIELKETQEKEQQVRIKHQENWKNVVNAGSDKYEDFQDITSPLFSNDFPSNPALADAILNSKFGTDILYLLGKNPKQARELALMSPYNAINKFAEIEKRFEEAKKNKVTPNKFSPPQALKSQSSTDGRNKSISELEKMSFKEYEEYQKQRKKKNSW